MSDLAIRLFGPDVGLFHELGHVLLHGKKEVHLEHDAGGGSKV